MEKCEFENKILDLLRKYDLIGIDQKIKKLIIWCNEYFGMLLTIVHEDIDENINIDEKIKYDISLEILKILKEYELIGNQSRIQKLKLILEADNLPIIKIEEVFMIVNPTIFENGEV